MYRYSNKQTVLKVSTQLTLHSSHNQCMHKAKQKTLEKEQAKQKKIQRKNEKRIKPKTVNNLVVNNTKHKIYGHNGKVHSIRETAG